MASPLPQSNPLVRKTKSNRTEIRCPRCEKWQDVLAYKTPEVVAKYGKSLNPIQKCGVCRHVFSLRIFGQASS